MDGLVVMDIDLSLVMDMEIMESTVQDVILYLELLMLEFVCREMKSKLRDVAMSKCWGCTFLDDYGMPQPNQESHNVCVMMEDDEKIDFCFSDLVEACDYEKVKKEYIEEVSDVVSELYPELLDTVFLKDRVMVWEDYVKEGLMTLL